MAIEIWCDICEELIGNLSPTDDMPIDDRIFTLNIGVEDGKIVCQKCGEEDGE